MSRKKMKKKRRKDIEANVTIIIAGKRFAGKVQPRK